MLVMKVRNLRLLYHMDNICLFIFEFSVIKEKACTRRKTACSSGKVARTDVVMLGKDSTYHYNWTYGFFIKFFLHHVLGFVLFNSELKS